MLKKLEKIAGKSNVLSSKEQRYCYSQDATFNTYEVNVPDAVVLPETTEQVCEILKYANANDIKVIARGAGTNLAGCCLSVKSEPGVCPDAKKSEKFIVMHFSRMNKILEINKQDLICKVQPGVIVGDLQDIVEAQGLFYPPDPSNLRVSTIGGSVALSSGGPRTFKYGTTKDYVIGLEVVLANGEVLKTGCNCAKNVTGYNLTQLFVGSEGTLGIVTQATLRLIAKPQEKRLLLCYFDKIENALEAVGGLICASITPAVVDFLDQMTIRTIEDYCHSGLLTDKNALLFVEIDGESVDVDCQEQKIDEICRNFGAVLIQKPENEEQTQKFWTARRSAFASCTKIAPNVLSEDIVVPRSKILELVKGIEKIAEKNQLTIAVMGHAGDGNMHPHFILDLRQDGVLQRFLSAKDELFNLALALGGSLSGEHGIGCEKSRYINQALDFNAIAYMKKIKQIFDPNDILNPNKIF